MNYRSISPTGSRWPQWLQNLKWKSGVYIIRRKRDHKVLYVGESHTGNLKRTLQRHFWPWRGATAGVFYDPDACEVAVKVLPRNRAVKKQNELIHRLKPVDNELDPIETEKRNKDPF